MDMLLHRSKRPVVKMHITIDRLVVRLHGDARPTAATHLAVRAPAHAAPPAVAPAGKSKWRSLKNTSKAASAFGKRKGKAPAPAAG